MFLKIIPVLKRLTWSDEYKKLVSALGSPVPSKNNLIFWSTKPGEIESLARLRYHVARPLHISLSPDHTTIGEQNFLFKLKRNSIVIILVQFFLS